MFNSKYKNLKSYLNVENRWTKILRFKNWNPRDQYLVASSVQLFNADIQLKIKELS